MQNKFASTVGVIASVDDIRALKGAALVTLHNELSNASVKRFGDAKTGMKRTIAAFEAWQGQQTEKAPKIVTPDNKSYRPDSKRGIIIELASKAGGATRAALKAATKWSDTDLTAAIARVESYNGLTVTKTGEGDEQIVVITGVLRTRKAFAFDAKKEQREHKAGTKRATVLEMLTNNGGATFAQIQEATKWDDRTAYEGIRLIHGYLGYGLRESSTGFITAFKK